MEAAGSHKENVIEGDIETVCGLSLQKEILFVWFCLFICLLEEDRKQG